MRRIRQPIPLLISALTAVAVLLATPAFAGMSSSADLGPNGMSSSASVAPYGMSSSAMVSLEKLLRAGLPVGPVAFPSIAPWVMVTHRAALYGNRSFYERNGLAAALDGCFGAERCEVQALAVRGDGAWALATSRGPAFSSPALAAADGLGVTLLSLALAGARVDDLALGDNGGFAVVAGGMVVARGALPSGLVAALERATAAGATVHHVATAGRHWAVATADGVSHSYNPALARVVASWGRQGFDVGPIGLGARGQFLVVEHVGFDVGPIGFDVGPIGFDVGPIGFDVGPIGFDVGPIGFEVGPIGFEVGPIGFEVGPIGDDR